MIRELENIRSDLTKQHSRNHIKAIQLYPGIELSYLTMAAEKMSLHHAALDHIFEINYCRSGRIGWKMGNADSVYLGQSDFSLHTLKTCADSVMFLPNGTYESLILSIIREIHEQLIMHMDQHFTIEDLSKQYLMNPTTLKAVFKSVYGTSLAAHIKEHRMKHAASLLRETNLSIAEIAGRVSYDSQSRFASAFKKYCGKLPKDYRNGLHS